MKLRANKAHIDEAYVLQAYKNVILEWCRQSYKGLEWEDRISEGNLTLLHIMRTYKSRYGDFSSYMSAEFKRVMAQKNTKAWATRKLETPFSLDASFFTDEDRWTLASCIGQDFPMDSQLNVECFTETLSSVEKEFIQLRLDGYSMNSISKKLGIQHSGIRLILKGVKNKLYNYYDEDKYT